MNDCRDCPTVVVVGGGLAGVCAAETILQNHDRCTVILLEASQVLGGRLRSATINDSHGKQHSVDIGGQFVGPLHTQLQGLLERFDLPLVPSYTDGADLVDDGKRVSRSVKVHKTVIPKLGVLSLLDLSINTKPKLERLIARTSRDEDEELNALTVSSWMTKHCWTEGSARLLQLCVELVFGCEPTQISMLTLVEFARASGGLDSLTEVLLVGTIC